MTEPVNHDADPQNAVHKKLPGGTSSKKKATVVSVIIHGVFIAVAGLIVAMTIPNEPQAEFTAPPPQRPKLEPRKLEMKVRVNQLNKRSSRPKLQPRMMVNAPSELALPEIKKNPQAVKKKVQRNFSTMGMAGVGSGMGGGYGTGMGGGMGGMGLPPTMADRCSPQNRSARMRRGGGRASSEKAVVKSLDWLQGQQGSDGSWGDKHKVAMTGLALLAYLGHCETPDSPAYGETVQKAIDYLISQSREGQLFAASGNGRSYSHGIASYALGEAYILTGDPAIRAPFVSAIKTIIKAQNNDGGWVYGMNGGSGESDTSVSGWQIQALKSAYLAGLDDVEGIEEALDKSVENMKRVHDEKTGEFGYRSADGKGHLTGVGIFTMTMWKHSNSPEVRRGVDYIMSRLEKDKDAGNRDMVYEKAHLYGLYYDVQAMFAQGGSSWKKYNGWFQSSMVDAQNADGSWPPTGNNEAGGAGMDADFSVYRNAVNTLMLEVYYRYLPVVDI